MQKEKRLNSILLKPSGPDCNMACEYCFYLKKSTLFSSSKTHRMSDTILEEVIRQMMLESVPEVSFSWQGGEPTLMGLEFFRKAIEFQKKYGSGKTVGNGFQTNGILINRDWAKFLKESNFLVGLSIDGPEHIHDRYRHMKNGQGSWSKVVDSAKRLLDAGVAVNALTVVNDYVVKFPEEIYDFHKQLGLNHMQFIPCVETDINDPARAAEFSVTSENYGEFLCKIFDLWRSDFSEGIPNTFIRFFDSLFYYYVDRIPPDCTFQQICGNYIVIEHNGDVYPCDFFVDSKWKLGNVMKDKLNDLLNSHKQFEFGKVKANLPEECKTCPWLNYCRGGCPKDRIRDPQDKGSNHFCKSYKMFFEKNDMQMRDIAREWKYQSELSVGRMKSSQSPGLSGKKIGRNDPCPCGSSRKYKNCCGKR